MAEPGPSTTMAGDAAGGQDAPELMSSFFPSPPSYFKHFTQANITLANKLVAHERFDKTQDDWQAHQTELLKDLGIDGEEITRCNDIDLKRLVLPPDVQPIAEDGSWLSYGQVWPITEHLPTLEEMGSKQMYRTPATFEGRRKALHTLLHTILHTYLRMLTVLTRGPPSIQAFQAAEKKAWEEARKTAEEKREPMQPLVPPQTELDAAIAHIRLATINIHHLCNEWRPIQARQTLKMLMRDQIDERKKKTEELRAACAEIQSKLEGLKTQVRPVHASGEDLADAMDSMDVQDQPLRTETDERREKAAEAKRKARQRMLEAIAKIS